MLQPYVAYLHSKKIILGSTSPRRKEILGRLNLTFEVFVAPVDEGAVQNELRRQNVPPVEYCRKLAQVKAESIISHFASKGDSSVNEQPDLVICADTVVEYEGKIFEKPKDEADAFQILSKLSGQTHRVHTGVCLAVRASSLLGSREMLSISVPNWCEISESSASKTLQLFAFHETTAVRMANYSENIARAYVATREPLDKAGAYGIQGIGGSLVEAIEGDYYNVVGFPLHRFAKTLTYILEHNAQGLNSDTSNQ